MLVTVTPPSGEPPVGNGDTVELTYANDAINTDQTQTFRTARGSRSSR